MTNKNPIHIVIKSPSGGVWNTARETARAWTDGGYDVRLTSALIHEMPNIENVKTSAMLDNEPHSRLSKLWRCVRGVFRFLKLEKPTHVVVYSLPLSVIFAILKPFYKYRLSVVTDMHASAHLKHGRQLNKKRSIIFKLVSCVTHNSFFYKIGMNLADYVIAHNYHMIHELIKNFGLDKEKGNAIPAFIDQKYFDTDLPKKRYQKTILYVGRMTDQKNIEDLIRAFELLSRKNNDAILKIAGDGPLEDRYRGMTNNPNIQFLGARDDIVDLHHDVNCVVLCSHYEGVSLVMMEAAANGVPMIAYDHLSGPVEFIKDGENGFLVPIYDKKLLVEAMEKSLEYDWRSDYIREMAQNFNPELVKNQYLSMIRDIQS